jgi:hypothetical protein
VESGRISEAGLQRLKNICEILFKKNREFSSVHQLCQFAARLGSKWYFQVSRHGYKLSKFLAVHRKYIINNDLVGPVRSQSLCALVTCIGVGGHPIPGCDQVLAQASIVNGWMNKSKKKYKFVISSLATDTFLQTREPDAAQEPDITQHVQV